MNKALIAGIAVALIAAVAILALVQPRDLEEDDLKLFKGVATAEIPGECLEHGEDICGLFDCMVEMCWCMETGPSGAILKQGSTAVSSEEKAVELVQSFVDETGSEYSDVKRAVSLHEEPYQVFFNVFAENESGDETVFTVAADGTIFKTVCGI